jgi:hypothetical protein
MNASDSERADLAGERASERKRFFSGRKCEQSDRRMTKRMIEMGMGKKRNGMKTGVARKREALAAARG